MPRRIPGTSARRVVVARRRVVDVDLQQPVQVVRLPVAPSGVGSPVGATHHLGRAAPVSPGGPARPRADSGRGGRGVGAAGDPGRSAPGPGSRGGRPRPAPGSRSSRPPRAGLTPRVQPDGDGPSAIGSACCQAVHPAGRSVRSSSRGAGPCHVAPTMLNRLVRRVTVRASPRARDQAWPARSTVVDRTTSPAGALRRTRAGRGSAGAAVAVPGTTTKVPARSSSVAGARDEGVPRSRIIRSHDARGARDAPVQPVSSRRARAAGQEKSSLRSRVRFSS